MNDTRWCWCCARWMLAVPAAPGRDTCARCANSTPPACERRHAAQALTAAKGPPA